MLAKPKKKPASAGMQLAGEQINASEQTSGEVTNIENFLFNPNKQLPAENVIISIQGKTVLSSKNVAVISGKPKSRKSVIAHSVLASGLCGKPILGIETNIEKNIVLIDTEQSDHDLKRSIQRMMQLARLNEISSKLKIYTVRQLNVLNTLNLLITVCQDAATGLIIVDGALDLINNMNDVEESKQVIELIKKLLVKNDVAIVLVIHQSKSTNFTIGHFGSFFDRFAQSVIEVSKLETGASKIASAMMRSAADFEPYEFYWNHNENNYTIDWLANENMLLVKPGDWPAQKHAEQVNKILSRHPDGITHGNFLIECAKQYSKSQHWCKDLIKHLYNAEIITKENNFISLVKPF